MPRPEVCHFRYGAGDARAVAELEQFRRFAAPLLIDRRLLAAPPKSGDFSYREVVARAVAELARVWREYRGFWLSRSFSQRLQSLATSATGKSSSPPVSKAWRLRLRGFWVHSEFPFATATP